MTYAAGAHVPIRNLRDLEELERVPLAERIFSWNANDWIARGLDRDPDKIALRYLTDGNPDSAPECVTYAALKRRSMQAANLFHASGVSAEDAVLFLLPTAPPLYAGILGALAAGIACCVNWMLEPEQWLELTEAARAKVIVALGPTPGFEIWEKLERVHDRLPASVKVFSVPGPGGRTLPDSDFETRAAAHHADRLGFERPIAPEDIAAYVHSGGTTGSPKLVRLTHRGFCYKFWANTLVMAHTPEDVIFSDYPMFHIAGFFGRGLLAIADGMSIVIPSPIGARDKRFIENYWRFVETFGITVLSGVPTTLAQLCKSPPRGENIASLRKYAVTGSTAFPAEVGRQLEALTGVRVMASYGATEYTQNVTQPPRDGDPRYGSAGIRLPYTSVKVVELDETGKIGWECATDEIGLVVVKGPSLTPGYVEPAHNAGVFTSDGWFNSGDLGRIDADGYLWITGRAKDVIIRGGHNIDPTMIENTLLRHADVLLAAAVSKPDAYAGELPMAYVQLVPGARTTAEELERFAQQNIPERAAAPKEIVILEKMPLTDIGKPTKAQLRQDAARRAFSAVVAEALGDDGRATVEVAPDPTRGSIALITIAGNELPARDEIESRVHERMKFFATPYEIRWAAPA